MASTSQLKLTELKEVLRYLGSTTSGFKNELILRLDQLLEAGGVSLHSVLVEMSELEDPSCLRARDRVSDFNDDEIEKESDIPNGGGAIPKTKGTAERRNSSRIPAAVLPL